MQYTIAIVEYTRLCGPLKASLEKLHELEREIEENERLQRESQEEVGLNTVIYIEFPDTYTRNSLHINYSNCVK